MSQKAPKPISEEIKNFYSAGSTFSFVGCAGAVQIVWAVLARLSPFFKSDLTGLIIAFIIVFAYALVIPEPEGYPGAGKFRVTVAELVFGILNSFIIFAVVLGLNLAL